MRHSLSALTAELKRLKSEGVRTVSISEETLAALRQAAGRRGAAQDEAVAGSVPALPKRPTASPVAPTRSTEEPGGGPAVKPPAPVADPSIPAPPAFQLPEGEKATRWQALRDRVLADPVCRSHVRPEKKVVFGVGSLDARILFVGEAPGAEEEVQGEPFVGPAGQLLTKMIGAMALQRSDVYIGNIMNWRPEMPTEPGAVQYGNRPPTAVEMAYCLPYLKAQIEIVNPEVIVALGATAAQGLLGAGSFKTLGEIRGRWHTFAGRPLMVTYHPSYILRNPVNRQKRLIWEDLLKVMEKTGLPISDKQRGFFLG